MIGSAGNMVCGHVQSNGGMGGAETVAHSILYENSEQNVTKV